MAGTARRARDDKCGKLNGARARATAGRPSPIAVDLALATASRSRPIAPPASRRLASARVFCLSALPGEGELVPASEFGPRFGARNSLPRSGVQSNK